MLSPSLDSFTRRATVNSIQLYQQYISLQKGFSCPHRILYGEGSCSDYVKSLLLDSSLIAVAPMSLKRFRSCAVAAQELQSQEGCIVVPYCIPL